MKSLRGVIAALGTMPDHPTKAQTAAYVAVMLVILAAIGLAGGSQ